ncbi:MAG: hypothetical protein IJ740_15230 [Ruminococcus sp.]|nr:hypothetical protein [Ruminococcus sp.]
MNKKQKRTLIKRTVSLLTSAVMLASALYTQEVIDVVKDTIIEVQASNDKVVRNEKITSLEKLYEFSEKYHNNPDDYQFINLKMGFTDTLTLESSHDFNGTTRTFYPIGTADCPFKGKITINTSLGMDQIYSVSLPLFDYVYDSVEIVNINNDSHQKNEFQITNEVGTGKSTPIFANHVLHDSDTGASPAQWDITVVGSGSYSGIFGSVEENAIVDIDLTLKTDANIVSDGDGSTADSNGYKYFTDAGLICGYMGKKATIDATITSGSTVTNVSKITSANGSAGGFVGKMDEGATLKLYPGSFDLSNTDRTITGKTYAGGLVGRNNGGNVIIKNAETDTDEIVFKTKGTIAADTAAGTAGGVFGYYKIASADNNKFSPTYYVSSEKGCKLKGNVAGGLIGTLYANGNDISYSGTATNVLTVRSSVSEKANTYGGIVGNYSNTDLTKTFDVQYVNVEIGGSGATNLGGVSGQILSDKNDSAVYVKADNFTVNAETGADKATYFGGVIGAAGTFGSMIDVGNITVTVGNGTSDKFVGGCIVGQLLSGVLRLSGVTDLSKAICENASSARGQIVGQRKDALVYALGSGSDDTDDASYGSGWRLIRSTFESPADDIGTWGEVVRISDIEGNDPIPYLVKFSETDHTATICAPKTEMSTARDLVATALNMQLNTGDTGALKFDSSTKRDTLLASNDLKIIGTISLSGTGITGFMRDGYASNESEIGSFTGTLSMGTPSSDSEEGEEEQQEEEETNTEAVIKLAVGERYGIINNTVISDNDTGGKGAIYAHTYNGLFARTGDGAKIENIKIDGTMNIIASVDNIHIGGAAAYSDRALTLTNVPASEIINYKRSSSSNHYIGGLIGQLYNSAGKDVTIQGDETDKTTVAPKIIITGTNISNADATASQCIGGVVGYVSSAGTGTDESDQAKVSISNITLSADIDASEATGSESNISTSGLIATYDNSAIDTKRLELSNIDVKNTVIKNKATNSTGGILGFRWYGTDVVMNNVNLISNNEIISSAEHIGGLVYLATGNWQIPSEGIKIDNIAFKKSDGSVAAPKSLGMIVHDGYYSNNGIFLEFKAENSYTLAEGLSYIPNMTMTGKVYDELVAYLAKDAASILTNATAGVISYYTSDGTYTSADEDKNSYNNIYNKTVVNKFSRYYYNADRDSYVYNSETYEGYKLLYWSLNRYAAANIKRCFTNPFDKDVLTGTFDLKNISYYPIDISENVSIGDATFVFYNTLIEDTETAADTKRSTRDGKSQHYTMHMGLFRNVSATITTTGNITLYGSVGVDGTYSGALINGTLTGTLNTAANKNITLGYYYSGAAYPLEISNTGKYLFINKIGDKAVLNLNGLYINGDAYVDTSDDTTYASSLIGDVQGIGINLTFNNIKIDARNKDTVTITGNKYGTTKSIFSNATLLNKLDVDSTSVAVYNFSQVDDWGKNNASMNTRQTGCGKVTYGRELTDSVEYENEENRYYENGENGNYIAPVTYPGKYSSDTAPLGTVYDFSLDYLPYVRYFTSDTTKVTTPPEATYTLREIKVNVVSSDLKSGCGTYDHPYSITSAKQLAAVSDMLDGNSNIPNIMLPVTNDGKHWCSTGTDEQGKNIHSCYLFTNKNDRYEYYQNETDENPLYTWEVNDVRKYLASAYYQIGTSITLGSTFKGLGAYNSEYAFKGVIVGLNNNITVTNTTATPLIKVSNGSVVKNLKIIVGYTGVFGTNGSKDTIFDYSSNALFYGGVIGKIMGGDNIIDNVSMTYSNNGFIKTQNQSLMCVGGYVGVIVNGGLVFRNMDSSKFISKNGFKVNKDGASTAENWVLDENNATAHSHLYVNPYIGRVINGYAINETTRYSGEPVALTDEQGNYIYKYYNANGVELTDVTDPDNDERVAETVQQFEYQYTLDNGTKNYQIADVKADIADSVKLYYDNKVNENDRVNIPDGQALFILSLITQSGAGTATSADGKYVYGVAYDCENTANRYDTNSAAQNVATHLAKYDKVGNIKYSEKDSGDYAIAAKDTYNDSKAIPYIIYHYTKADSSGKYPARKMTGATDFMKLSTAGGTYNLPESFRGIGSICNGKYSVKNGANNADKDNEYQMHIYGFEGNDSTINEQILFNTYTNTNDNYANNVYGDSNINLGFGLFNILVQKAKDDDGTTYNLDEGYYIGNFNLTGKVVVKEYDKSGQEEKGGFDTTNGNKSPYRNRYAVGGLAGGTLVTQFTRTNANTIINSSVNTYVNVYDLDLDSLTITGTSWCGGYIGRNNITEYDANYGSGKMNLFFNGCDATKVIITGSQGCSGGILGGSMSGFPSLYINTAKPKSGDTHSTGADGYFSSTMKLSITNNGDCSQCGIGAVAGTIRNGYEVTLWVNNLTVEGYGANNGFSNGSTSVKTIWTQGVGGLFGFVRKADSVVITNCEIKNIDISGPMSGGLFGNIDKYDTAPDFGVSPRIKIFNTKIYSGNNNNNISAIIGAGGVSGQFITSKSYTDNVVGYNGETFIYDIDGCEVYGYTISQTGTDDKECGAGGFIGYANNAQRTIVNSRVHDCTIKVDGSQGKHGMGGLVGDTSKGIWGYNIAAYNNTFAFNGTGTSAKCGGFIGNTNGQELKIVGFTRKNNKMSDETAVTLDWDKNSKPSNGSYIIDADYMNISTGSSHGEAMAKGFENGTNVGEGAAKKYFPYVTVRPKIGVGGDNFLTGDGVSIVDVESKNNENETVVTKTLLAELITDEFSGTAADNRIAYKTVSEDDISKVKTLIERGKVSGQDYDIKLTTYKNEMGTPAGYEGEDFPIIAIGDSETNYNDYINAYIRVLTNTDTTDNYNETNSDKYIVDIYPCRCINGVYQKYDKDGDKTISPGFKLDGGLFKMDDDNADSIQDNNQISMIDIRFLDPTDEDKTAYHLYIPVLTKKLLKFNFSSAALQGSEYEPTVYRNKMPDTWNSSSKLGANFDNWQTIYTEFEYTKDEMDKFLLTGKGLNWNISKTLYFRYNGKKSIANSTQYVLVDNNNNADKEYYTTKSDGVQTAQDGNAYDIISFNKFKTERNKNAQIEPKVFEPQTINDIAGKKITYELAEDGKYVLCEDQTEHPDSIAYAYVGDDIKYFKAYTNEPFNERYTLTATGSIVESYYLSIYTYEKDNTVTETTHNAYDFSVECPTTFTGPIITCQRSAYKNTIIYLGDFLSQSLTIKDVNTNEQISSSNHTLLATIESTLEFSSDNAAHFYSSLIGEELYQGFFLYLKKYDDDGNPIDDESTIKGEPTYSYKRYVNDEPVGSGIDYTDTVDEGAPYIYIEPVTISITENENGSKWQSVQSAVVTVEYSANENILIKEFPTRRQQTNTHQGIGLDATARLDFASNRVPYSNNIAEIAITKKPIQRYHINKAVDNGILTLNAIEQPANDEYDTYGEQSHNKSALGINAKYIETGEKYSEMQNKEHIEAGMDYELTNLPDEVFDGNHQVTFKMTLEQKVDTDSSPGYKYEPVNIEDNGAEFTGYLTDFKFIGEEGEDPLTLTSETENGIKYYTYTMSLTDSPDSWPIKYVDSGTQKHMYANVEFNVRTAADLERISDYKYSNYRLKMSAVISSTEESDITTFESTEDWVIYTNAKVNAQYVKKAS